uniref:J domain-containing protein n=1 Tax=Leersia perrieri TaxID=77586 RepID=A0A0D9XEL2_9ORYZ
MDPAAAAARGQADQWMRVAEKLLMARDLEGCKEFVSQALGTDPHVPGANDLLAAADVLLAAQRRRIPNGQPDPYAVLGLDPGNPASRRPDAVHSQYRRLSFLLNRSHPDRPCSLSFAEAARLVADSWAFLSDPVLKSALDAELDAAAAAAAAKAARVYHPPAPMQQPPQHPPQPTPPKPASQQTAPVRVAPQQAAPLRAAPQQPAPVRAAPQQAAPLRAAPLQPTPLRAAPQSTPPRAAAVQSTPPQPRVAPQPPVAAAAVPPSSSFWTVCMTCCNIHQYDRLYEARKLMCPSCHQPFVAEAMAEPPPIVPGTDMYYCTWGFFPVGFPGCPGFEKMVNSQKQGTDQLNTPLLGATGGVEGDATACAENGAPVSAAVELQSMPKPAKPVRVKVGAKKRGRPKGSKNKKNL